MPERSRQVPDGDAAQSAPPPAPERSRHAPNGDAAQSAPPPGTNRYEIRVAGHVDVRRARALGSDECRWLPDGDSLLVATAADQAATYGLIARIRDAGLELIAVARVPAPVSAGEPSGPGDAQV